MPHIDVMITYRLDLTPDEFSTMGKALAASDDPKAKELNIAIQRMRTKQTKLAAERSEAVLKTLEDQA